MEPLHNVMLLGGRWTSTAQSREVRDPGNGELVGIVAHADITHAEAALRAADDARATARAMPVHRRQDILEGAARRIDDHAESFAQLIAREGIKTICEARSEVRRAGMTLRLCAQEAGRLQGETIDFGQRPGSEWRTGYFSKQPVGVVLAITPYNDPLNLVAHKIGPAIATGNSVILKPHEQTPLSALMLAQVLLDAGLPDNQLQVITGDGALLGPVLVSDARVRMISFTGGHAAGMQIARAAGMKRLSMEAGGNCPTLVMHDADIARAIPSCVAGAYSAAGQNCLHVQRLLVHADIYDQFVDGFVAGARALRTGDKSDEATDMGCLVSAHAAGRLARAIDDACSHGARVLTGGDVSGSLMTPTLLDNVPPSHPLMAAETFGPVTCIARFTTPQQAFDMANAVDYGLQAAIFTSDVHTAFDAIDRLEAGAVLVNDSSDYRIDSMPFGGLKGSGFGREGVRWAMQEMTETKVACFNRTCPLPDEDRSAAMAASSFNGTCFAQPTP